MEPTTTVEYSNLQQLLAVANWRKADEETARVMLEVAKREKEGCLRDKDIEKFPCEDLQAIDQLWLQYSNGRFGFSVQKPIWESVGGKPGEYDYEIFKKFADRLGWYVKENCNWKSYQDLTFSLDAPVGHFPWILRGVVLGVDEFCLFIFSRIESCQL